MGGFDFHVRQKTVPMNRATAVSTAMQGYAAQGAVVIQPGC